MAIRFNIHKTEPARVGLRMTPMIDVVFLLLLFFLLSSNFRSQEGFLPAELPRQVTRGQAMEIEPLVIHLQTLPNGTCQVSISGQPTLILNPANFQALAPYLQDILTRQGRHAEDPIKLAPSARTKWDHVVKTYDALWQLNLHHIIFAASGTSS